METKKQRRGRKEIKESRMVEGKEVRKEGRKQRGGRKEGKEGRKEGGKQRGGRKEGKEGRKEGV